MNLPKGFRYSAVDAGIRKERKPDLALIVSEVDASAAAVFTTNKVQAAPVKVARQHLDASDGKARAVLVNAGNANCATRTGDKVALATVRAAAKAMGVSTTRVLPASTGVIGVELNPALITEALPALLAGLSPDRFTDVADAILTTDTVRKTEVVETGGVSFAGLTKGSGMIHPNMATTLAFVMTDADIAPHTLKSMLKRAVATSYNRLSVDGDMSTNDTLLVLANGASGLKPSAKQKAEYEEALTEVCISLAKQIARDGEGAKKLIEIEVRGALTGSDADRIGRAIANSPLVKTAIAGSDPNWGRILSAAGYSGARFHPSHAHIWMQGVRVCRKGLAAQFDEAELSKKLDAPECKIVFALAGPGTATARFWTCDFTEGYIDINSRYRT